MIQAAQVGDGPSGLGTRSKGTSKVLGRQFDWVTENVHFDPPKQTVIRSVEGKFDFTISNVLEPETSGSRLTYRVEVANGMGGFLANLRIRSCTRPMRAPFGQTWRLWRTCWPNIPAASRSSREPARAQCARKAYPRTFLTLILRRRAGVWPVTE